jgi:hypothetical protein
MNVVGRFATIAILVFGLVLAGCFPAVGEVKIITQAQPNPLVGVKDYGLAPVSWEGFTYDGQAEAAWLATRTPEQRASFEQDKIAINKKLAERFEVDKDDEETFTAGADGRFSLAYTMLSYTDGQFFWRLEVRDKSGKVVDALESHAGGTGYGFAFDFNLAVVAMSTQALEHLRARRGG